MVESCKIIMSALQSSKSPLREFDVSNNDLQDLGVQLISDALKNPNCQIEILRLSGCMVTGKGCFYLASALSSNPSHLRELDLSYNHPEQSALKLLSYKNDPDYALQILNMDHAGEFRITPGLHKYACNLTMDPSTAHTLLKLSDENKKAMLMKEQQNKTDPERFEFHPQVLCRESLTGRCYWEAEWSGSKAHIAVAYKSISRGQFLESMFGFSRNSWSLFCSDNKFVADNNNNKLDIYAPSPFSNRVGVYLDWLEGILSFYSISDPHTLTHLHTFNTKFTEPLYAGFAVHSSVSLCDRHKQACE